MSAEVVSLDGKRVEPAAFGDTPKEVLLKLLADIDAGKPVAKVAFVLLVEDVAQPGMCSYESWGSDMTLFECHALHSIAAQMKMNQVLGCG